MTNKETGTKPKFHVGDKVIYDGMVGIVQDERDNDGNYDVWFRMEVYNGDIFYEEELKPYAEPSWEFTDKEKEILRSLPKKYKWIVRDEIGRDKFGSLWVCDDKPYKFCLKDEPHWKTRKMFVDSQDLYDYRDIFKTVKYDDIEPCEFRKYI